MLTTLTILSLDQGKIYSPPPDQLDEAAKEINSLSRRRQTGKTAGIVLDWFTAPIFGLRLTFDRLVSVRRSRVRTPSQPTILTQ